MNKNTKYIANAFIVTAIIAALALGFVAFVQLDNKSNVQKVRILN